MTESFTPFKDTRALRQEIIDTCFYLRDRLGYFIGTWGNISVRVEDGMMLTPTRIDLEKMGPDDLVVVDMEGRKVRGERVPTSELELHRQLLLERPDIGALVHSHSVWASVFACARRPLPVILDDMAEVVGGDVRCSEYVPAAHHKELAQAVRQAIGPDAMAVLIANHGVVAGGRDLKEAVICNQFVEKAAQVYLHAEAIGGVKTISEAQWRPERHRYLYKYGKAEDLVEVFGRSPTQPGT